MGQCEIVLWEDDFDGEEVNRTHWNIEYDNSGGGNAELQYYTPRDTNVYIENGKLIIRALKEEFEGRSYTSGKLTTKGLADWKYGRLEASIKMAEGRGMWPAFWMMPSESKYGGWPNSGEIDIVELIGHDTNTVYGTLHYGPPWNYTNGMYSLEEGYFSDTAHRYSIEWAPDSIKWYVNDERYSIKTKDSLRRPEQWRAFQERFYIILNLAVGGNWPGDPDENTRFPQTMEIDYVRVYGDPSMQEIIAADSAYPMATGVRYSFTAIPGAVFNWAVPSGAVITGGQGTSSILVDWGCTPGEVTLEVTNIACEDQFYSLPVTFANIQISGDTLLYPLSEVLFTAPSLNETSYSWTLPADADQLSSTGDTLVVKWGCSESFVVVATENVCGVMSDTLHIYLREPALSGPTTVSENSSGIIYTVDPIPESVFTWSVPSDAEIVSGQGTDSVQVDFGSEPGGVTVEIANSCYTSLLELQIRITDTILLADYESVSLTFDVFSSTTFTKAENPAPDEINPSQHVGESFKSEVAWGGIYADLGYNLDMNRHKKFNLKVLGPKTGNVLLKLEDNDEGVTPFIEVPVAYTTANAWQNLEFNFPGAVSDVYDRITIFFDFGSVIENTFYFDDLTLLPEPSALSSGVSDEEGFAVFPNPAKEVLYYRLDNISGDAVIVHIYDMEGRKILNGIAGEGNSIDISGLKKGVYLIEVICGNQQFRRLFVSQ